MCGGVSASTAPTIRAGNRCSAFSGPHKAFRVQSIFDQNRTRLRTESSGLGLGPVRSAVLFCQKPLGFWGPQMRALLEWTGVMGQTGAGASEASVRALPVCPWPWGSPPPYGTACCHSSPVSMLPSRAAGFPPSCLIWSCPFPHSFPTALPANHGVLRTVGWIGGALRSVEH